MHRRRYRRRAGPERDGLTDLTALFSESNTRWLVEVDKGREEEFVQRMGVPALRIGEVGGDELRIMNDGLVLVPT